jgi:hypothetical protein
MKIRMIELGIKKIGTNKLVTKDQINSQCFDFLKKENSIYNKK